MILILLALAGLAILLLGVAGVSTVQSTKTNCPPPPAPSPQILAMARAIAQAEGSNPAWNNPGDLTASFGYPTTGTVNTAGVLQFVYCSDGWNALYKQLSSIINGTSRYSLDDTISSFGLGYSGGDPNWAVNVSSALGVTPDTTLGQVLA